MSRMGDAFLDSPEYAELLLAQGDAGALERQAAGRTRLEVEPGSTTPIIPIFMKGQAVEFKGRPFRVVAVEIVAGRGGDSAWHVDVEPIA